ncbi:hypothetical protein ACQP1G_33085 [Nocardia sp. CA-107356]|uniref:hypothetical protein n=1 Tax=Nocardia sp. CA-107356 TaxID=3239972 RepID=UPI003D92ACCD
MFKLLMRTVFWGYPAGAIMTGHVDGPDAPRSITAMRIVVCQFFRSLGKGIPVLL